jgi:hypothetical protein
MIGPFDFIEMVVLICSKHRGSISSWGRTPKRNKEVGGHPNSYHMLWLGADVILDEMIKNERFENDAGKFGLLAIYEGDHYHLQPK